MAKIYYDVGRYWAKIVHQHLGESTNGFGQFETTIEILGSIDPENPDGDLLPCGEHFERTIYDVLSAKTQTWVIENLRKLGFTSMVFDDFKLTSPSCCDLRGRELAVWCNHKANDKGEMKEEWKPASDRQPKEEMDPKGVRALNAMFGKYLKANPAEPAQPEAAAPAKPAKAERTAPRAAATAKKATPEDLDDLNKKFDEAMDSSQEAGDDIPF